MSKIPLANIINHHCYFRNEETVTQIIDMKIIKPYGVGGRAGSITQIKYSFIC